MRQWHVKYSNHMDQEPKTGNHKGETIWGSVILPFQFNILNYPREGKELLDVLLCCTEWDIAHFHSPCLPWTKKLTKWERVKGKGLLNIQFQLKVTQIYAWHFLNEEHIKIFAWLATAKKNITILLNFSPNNLSGVESFSMKRDKIKYVHILAQTIKLLSTIVNNPGAKQMNSRSWAISSKNLA